MSSEKEILKHLLAIADKQQKAIAKLAQAVKAPKEYKPIHPTLSEERAILGALPPTARAAVKQLEVHKSADPAFNGEVRVSFLPNKGSDEVFDAVQKTVANLAQSNVLPGANYLVKEVI